MSKPKILPVIEALFKLTQAPQDMELYGRAYKCFDVNKNILAHNKDRWFCGFHLALRLLHASEYMGYGWKSAVLEDENWRHALDPILDNVRDGRLLVRSVVHGRSRGRARCQECSMEQAGAPWPRGFVIMFGKPRRDRHG